MRSRLLLRPNDQRKLIIYISSIFIVVYSKRMLMYISTFRGNQAIPLGDGKSATLEFDVNDKNSEVNYLEHVDVLSNIHYGRRGCLEIDVVSPSGSILSVTKILNF